MKRIISIGVFWAISAPVLCGAKGLTYWGLTRESTAVVVGTVTKVDGNVRMSVDHILKGKDVPKVVVFPHPPIPKIPRNVVIYPPPRIIRFATGNSWLVFLQANRPSGYSLLDAVTKDTQQAVERTVRDVMALDSLKDETAKCKMLVSLASPYKLFSYLALWELQKYNKPEFLELLAPLAREPRAKPNYIHLLQRNPNSRATDILLGFLKDEDQSLLQEIIDALGRRETKNAELSKTLLPYVSHDNPRVRMTAVFVLGYREYRDAFPEIVKCLDDPDPRVRSNALHWPWYSYIDEHHEVVPKIRELAHDSNEGVRAEACRTLISIRDLPSFYSLWSQCLFDKSKLVRRAIHLDLLLEHSPVVVVALLLWPTVIVALALSILARHLQLRRRIAMMLLGAAGGYAVGAVAGYVVGTHHASRLDIQTLLLMPSVGVPLGMLSIIVFQIFRKGHSTAQVSDSSTRLP